MIKLSDILNILKPQKVFGEVNRDISSMKSIEDFKLFDDNSICWINSRNIKVIEQIECGTVICSNFDNLEVNKNCTIIIVEDPRKAFAKVMNVFFIEEEPIGIHKSAIIDRTVKIGKNVSVGPNSIIEKLCVIGDNVIIGANNVIKRKTIIDENVKIGSNNTIGDAGFGFEKDEIGMYKKIQHTGSVYIQKNAEISNNVCIDRAVLGRTIIGENSKIDNLVHIAHGVKIGKNTLIIANTMIAGSSTIGDNVWIAPSSSILNKISINDNSVIGMGTVVLKDVEKNSIVAGNPGRELKKK